MSGKISRGVEDAVGVVCKSNWRVRIAAKLYGVDPSSVHRALNRLCYKKNGRWVMKGDKP